MRRFVLCLVFFFCANARAAIFTVTNTSDAATDGVCDVAGVGDGCTLREAINFANSNADASVITFDATVFAAPRQTISVPVGDLPAITTDVTIAAPAAGVIVSSSASGGNPFAPKYVLRVDGGTVVLDGLTLTGNKALNGTAGVFTTGGNLTLRNCTLTGHAYGVSSDQNQNVALENCTLTGNQTALLDLSGTITVKNCTLTGNSDNLVVFIKDFAPTPPSYFIASNTIFVGSADDTAVQLGGDHNLYKTTDADAGLDPNGLQENGGPTQTIALLSGSPAIDAGNSALTTDQRGSTRPIDLASANASGGNGSDIGAYELNESTLPGANFVVNTVADHDDGACGTSDCSLREAINAANANANDSKITFQSDLVGTIQLDSVLPDLNSKINLQGPGGGDITVRGEGAADPYRIFLVTYGQVVTISGLIITNGQATDVGGGAIANNHGTLKVINCFLIGNTGDDGGAIYSAASAGAGSLSVLGCGFSDNIGNFAGGAILNDGFNGSAALTVTVCAFFNNSTGGAGGAIFANGGAQAGFTGFASVDVFGSTFTGNTANGNGGAICLSGNDGSAKLTVNSSTFASNTANNNGGAILSSGVNGTATTNIVNSTFDDNFAGSRGGGFYNDGSGGGLATATVKSCTFNVNNASFGGSAIWSSGAAASTVQIRNNIFAVGTAGITLADDSNGSLISQGYNLADDTAGSYITATGDQSNLSDLKLGALAYNGGLTETIELLPGSPAIDAGKSTLATDQRGNSRPVDLAIANAMGGDGSDVGAFELNEAAQTGPNFVVTTIADHDDGTCGPADCTLREAINAANADASDNAITFDATVFATRKTITLQLSQLSTAGNGTVAITAPTVGVIVSGKNLSRVLSNPAATATLTGLTLTNATGGNENGGAIENGGDLTLINCTVSNSSANNGGGATNTGTLTVQNCTFSGDAGGYGGALLNDGTLIVDNSTFSGNTGFNNGGALHNSSGNATFTNCTFSGNQALGSGTAGNGGGISNFGNLTVNNSTLSGNAANVRGGGVFSDANGTFNLNNSILAGNSASTDGADISGTQASGDYNLVQDTAGVTLSGTHNIMGQAPNLGPLANNGGPTQTFALLATSPAINAGDPAFDGVGKTDQRGTGFVRVHGGTVDIGAFESPNRAPTGIPLSNASIAENSGANADVGTLSATDPDFGDSFTFTLPAGRGSNSLFSIGKGRNGLFAIGNGDILQAKGSLNYEKQNSYVVFVRATDKEGLSFDKKLTITVTDTNDAPVLDNSGDVQLTVSAKGISITALLATGANGAPISDEDVGAVQGIAAFAADSLHGMWQFTTDGGATWTPLGITSSSHARLLAADNGNTRLRFLPKSPKATAPLANALKFFAWDRTTGANGSEADASPALRGGKSAFSVALESLTVLAPGSAGLQITISIPQKGTFAISPAQANGTASADSGIVEVRCLYLYRTNAGANPTGYWNGDINNPRFGVYSANNQRLATDTATGGAEPYSTWSLNLPVLSQGTYDLRMQAKDAYGKTKAKDVIFTINDGTPSVAFLSPTNGASYPVGSLSEATGTANDADGISKVTLYLYRSADVNNTAGYWNGDIDNPQFTPTYTPSTNERPATDTATGGAPAYSTWRRLLPALTEGSYTLRVTARDTVGNFSFAIAHITITPAIGAASQKSAPSGDDTLASIIAAANESSGAITLTFGDAAPTGDFSVTVNGSGLETQSVQRDGNSVTLLLPEGALKAGDEIGVGWKDGALTLKAE